MRFVSAALVATCLSLGACDASPEPAQLSVDLQATGVKNLAMPRPGLLTAGQPTEAQLEQLARLGVKRVICLRPEDEPDTGWEEAKAEALGIDFVRLPVPGAPAVSVANAHRLGEEIAAAHGATTMVCCASSNRVGALLALHAFHDEKMPAPEALALGKAAGLKSLEPQVQALLK
ncbi:MAG: sulfur transferase domain-containing protein [Planctomycetota bacterium]